MRRPVIRPVGVRADEVGVTDVLGSILLVGMTVAMAVGLGILLLTFDGPARTTRADLAVSVDPGSGGWGTGDETVRLLHRGGDPLAASSTNLVVRIGSTSTALSGTTQLASVFADGRLTIGEIWQRTVTVQQGQSVGLQVIVADGGGSVLLSNAALVASATSSTQPCSSDSSAPTVLLWQQVPSLVTGLTTGSVTVRAQLTDNCWGVNQATTPSLFWRVTPRDTAYASVAMTNVGLSTWQGIIPAQTWSALVGQTLQYYLSPIADLGGNSGASVVRAVTIQSDCSTDISPPAVGTLTQSPADVRTTTLTAVTVTITVSDECAGLASTAPHLWYRINSGTNPAYTDATPSGMTLQSPGTWQGTIPNPTWALFVGQTLEWYVTGYADLNGNVGTTATQSDVIELLATYTYPSGNTVTSGSVTAFANLQSATDSGAAATLAEAGTVGTPTTQSFNANGVVNGNGWTGASGTNLAASDNTYATYSTNNPAAANDLQVALANPASSQGTITRVVVSAEVSITGGASNDGFQLMGCLSGGSCTAYGSTTTGSGTDATMTYDITSLRPGGGSWSWTDITNLEGVVSLVQQGSRDGTWRVDRVWADVTFTTTTYAMSIRLDWTGVPAGITQTLDLRYSVTGDTFNVQVCQLWALGSCNTWATRGTSLTSTSLATWQYTLLANEVSGGRAAIRFVDVTPGGTAQGNLNLDYARVMTI